MKECIACAEEIKENAKLCKHCGTRQDSAEYDVEMISAHADGVDLAGDPNLEVPGVTEVDEQQPNARIKPAHDSIGDAPASVSSGVSKFTWIPVLVVVGWILLAMVQGFSSGGGSPAVSAFYKYGQEWAIANLSKNQDRISSYNMCNIGANSFYAVNPGSSQEQMDDWIQGCLDWVRN